MTLPANHSYGNAANYSYSTSGGAGATITNLVRFGNLNDNFAVLGGSGSRILDTFAASKNVPSILPGGFRQEPITLPIPAPPGGTPPENYAVNCSVQEGTGTVDTLKVDHIISIAQNVVTVRIVNQDPNEGHSGTLHCTAVFRPPL